MESSARSHHLNVTDNSHLKNKIKNSCKRAAVAPAAVTTIITIGLIMKIKTKIINKRKKNNNNNSNNNNKIWHHQNHYSPNQTTRYDKNSNKNRV